MRKSERNSRVCVNRYKKIIVNVREFYMRKSMAKCKKETLETYFIIYESKTLAFFYRHKYQSRFASKKKAEQRRNFFRFKKAF